MLEFTSVDSDDTILNNQYNHPKTKRKENSSLNVQLNSNVCYEINEANVSREEALNTITVFRPQMGV
ncbi:hypothetical protein K0M31_002080 [Melipona bicolor]|uniref:Uncharacterized protein n=1 Tax=Melipona bicolor TaxID=60889 RepID=A0AA40GGS2_9HYME|nr:hypothetical protein K0M31_002080 [Melipona bicolor]